MIPSWMFVQYKSLFKMLSYNNILKQNMHLCVPAVITFVPAVMVEMDSPDIV